jgi:Sulfotransferase domain
MPLKIIGTGLARTGTSSLKIAIEKLGIGRCYHMKEVLADPEHIGFWVEVAEGRANFDRVFSGYSATVDFPACIYWRDLIEYYPEAKIILSIRDAEDWFRATQKTFLSPRLWESGLSGPFGDMFGAMIRRFFDGEIHDHDHLIELFDRHVEEIKVLVPPERLLIFKVTQGWQPLCKFLGLPMPDEPFPHANREQDTRGFLEDSMASIAGAEVGALSIAATQTTSTSVI